MKRVVLYPPHVAPKIRNDNSGNGHFGASRLNNIAGHPGLDLSSEPGDANLGIYDGGHVRKLGRLHHGTGTMKDTLRYVEVDIGPLFYRVCYIEPNVQVGDRVTLTTVIGTTQNIQEAYGDPSLTNHIHIEVWAVNGHAANLRRTKPEDVIVINPLLIMDLDVRKRELLTREALKGHIRNPSHDVPVTLQDRIMDGFNALRASMTMKRKR